MSLLLVFFRRFWSGPLGFLGCPRSVLPPPLGAATHTSPLLFPVARPVAFPGPGSRLRWAAVPLSFFLFLFAAPTGALRCGVRVRVGVFVFLGRFFQRLSEQLLPVVLHLLGDGPARLDALGAALQVVLIAHYFYLDLSKHTWVRVVSFCNI